MCGAGGTYVLAILVGGGFVDSMTICWSIACCWRLSWLLLAASCWSNALIWVALASMDALVWTDRFAMCKLIVPATVSAVSFSETSSSAERPAYLLVYLPCAAIVASVLRGCWYAVWMKGQRCNHVLSESALLSQSLMLRMYILQCVRRLMTFINSCLSVYGTFAMITISWQSE